MHSQRKSPDKRNKVHGSCLILQGNFDFLVIYILYLKTAARQRLEIKVYLKGLKKFNKGKLSLLHSCSLLWERFYLRLIPCAPKTLNLWRAFLSHVVSLLQRYESIFSSEYLKKWRRILEFSLTRFTPNKWFWFSLSSTN